MTRRARQLIALVAATAAALALPTAAWASPDAVIRDCAQDGSLDSRHSDADKRAALGQLSAELEEYSDCRSVIGAAIGGGPRANSSSSSDDGDAAGTPGDKAKSRRAARAKGKDRAREQHATEVALGDRVVDPRSAGVLDSEETANGISLPVVLALIALGLMGAAGALLLLSKRNPRVADALRRVPLPRFRR